MSDLNERYNMVINGFAALCEDNEINDEEMLRIAATIFAFITSASEVESVDTEFGKVMLITNQQ